MILKRAVILRDRLLDQLINVDLIGDFFDMPVFRQPDLALIITSIRLTRLLCHRLSPAFKLLPGDFLFFCIDQFHLPMHEMYIIIIAGRRLCSLMRAILIQQTDIPRL